MDAAAQSGMRAYSLDLKERVVRVVAEDQPMRAAARRFGGRVSAANCSVVRQQPTGSLARQPMPDRPRENIREQEPFLRARLEEAPYATVLQHCAWWAEQLSQPLSAATMWQALRPLWTAWSTPAKRRASPRRIK